MAEWQEFCSERCATRVRVQRHRARKRGGDGGPGGGKQPLLFSPSDVRLRKPAKVAVAKPQQDALFPADISSWFEGLTPAQQQEVKRIALEATRGDGAASDNATRELTDIMLNSRRKPSRSVSVIESFLREASLAA